MQLPSLSGITSISLLTLLFLVPYTSYGQRDPQTFPPPLSADSAVQRIQREWPDVRLIGMDSEVADALMIAELSEKIDQIEGMVFDIFIEQLPAFSQKALTALQSKEGKTFEGFKAAFYHLPLYPGYEDDYNLRLDGLRQIFIIGTEILSRLQRVPYPLYLLVSGPTTNPKIHSILSFDSATGNFRAASDTYPLNYTKESDLLRYFDSIANSYLRFPDAFPVDENVVNMDSARRWYSINRAIGRERFKGPWVLSTAILPDSLVEKFQREWSSLKLIALDSETAEIVWKADLMEDIKRLQDIGEVVAPNPLPDFDQFAIRATQSASGKTLNGFRMLLCEHYSEYNCDEDFDSDFCQTAFNVAEAFNSEMKTIPPTLYLLISQANETPEIYALLGFDPRPHKTGMVNYEYILDKTTREMLRQRYCR